MKMIGNRISVVDGKDKTTIIILPEKKVFITALMGAWMFMWYSIGITVIWAYFALKLTQQEGLILLIFLSFWLYYAIRVTRSFLWLMKGSENIKIDSIGVTIKNSIGKMGKAKMFYLENIKKIHLDLPKEKSLQTAFESSPWIRGGERIEFEYMGKVIRIGQKLNEKDATLLFNLCTKRIEDHIKQRARKERDN